MRLSPLKEDRAGERWGMTSQMRVREEDVSEDVAFGPHGEKETTQEDSGREHQVAGADEQSFWGRKELGLHGQQKGAGGAVMWTQGPRCESRRRQGSHGAGPYCPPRSHSKALETR